VVQQVVQILGALAILACFVAAQFDRLDAESYRYLIPNAAGSSALAVTAVLSEDWGFVFLEGTWALVSYWGLVSRLAGARRDAEEARR
jgi:hypothetical protein